ncbi:unnamed protein product [Paramecium sonneborni]|uniref:Uncharacterized protein n=1 Tax=Paramecium sonneborni TaxID=65129 RepID=A0A8S1P8P1_9CILI|nr:unnamed protein product [Paramecium sonneborni]
MGIKQSNGKKQKLTYLSKIPNFWKNYQISHLKVQEQFDSGDIVLFKSKHKLAVAYRKLVCSEFDHVAICYKQNEELQVYEVVQKGVQMFQWDQLKLQEWYKHFEKICIRKLNYNKKNDYRVRFSNFLEENLGNEYNLSVGKIFTFTSKIKKPNNGEKVEQKRSFFCSELVAKAYKVIGLLDQGKSCTQYYPKDFSQEKELELLQGATLSPEYLVVFEE